MTQPLVSFVVPFYNSEKYLCKCIDSIVAQTIQDFELILVDDFSTDNSRVIADEIANRYCHNGLNINVYTSDGKGVSYARNLGLLKANGKWICFVDSDDTIADSIVSDIVERQDIQSDIDVVFWGYEEVFSNKTIRHLNDKCLDFLSSQDIHELYINILDRYSNVSFGGEGFHTSGPCIKAYRRSVIDKSGARFPLNITNGEDLYFNLLFFGEAKKGTYVKKVGYSYIRHQNSATKSYKESIVENYNVLIDLLSNEIRNQDDLVQMALKRRKITCLMFDAILYYFNKDCTLRFSDASEQFAKLCMSDRYKDCMDVTLISSYPGTKRLMCWFIIKRRLFWVYLFIRMNGLFGNVKY